MKQGWVIKCFAYTEIILGITSLFSLIPYSLNSQPPYPATVIAFLFTTALISTSLGIGILKHNTQAYYLLLFFSGVIVLSKILILSKIISLNQSISSWLTPGVKDSVSFIYHCLLVFYFTRKSVIKLFLETAKNAKL